MSEVTQIVNKTGQKKHKTHTTTMSTKLIVFHLSHILVGGFNFGSFIVNFIGMFEFV